MQIRILLYSLLLMVGPWPLLEVSSQEQVDTTDRCYILGEEVIFEFDTRNEHKENKNPIVYDFQDLDIYEIARSGDIENWSRDGWLMRQINEFTFQIRKKLSDFRDHLNYWDKFNLAKKYWIAPLSEIKEQPDYPKDERIIDDLGNTTFHIEGYTNVDWVILSGSFNNWTEESFYMNRSNSGWDLTLDLPPGIYEYKFIVDGQWMHDPQNPQNIENEHGTLNSILLVGKEVKFELLGYSQASNVYLVGSFNNWETDITPMAWNGQAWETTLKIPPGKHYYKYIVDGYWIMDPSHSLTQKDNRGNENSVLLVY